MKNRNKDQNSAFPLIGNEDLKTHPKESQNRDTNSAALKALVAELARQAAQKDFDAQQKLH